MITHSPSSTDDNNIVTTKTTDASVKNEETTNTQVSGELPLEEAEAITKPVVVDMKRYDDVAKRTCVIKGENEYVVGVSLRGKSHVLDNLPCQDNHAFETVAAGWDLYVVSDGAGSAKNAERGSQANCKLIIKLVRQLLENNNWVSDDFFPSELEWYIEMRSVFETMHLFYQTKIESFSDGSEMKDFNATALVVLVTPKGMLSAHIGDGRMGYKDSQNNWHALMTPHKGEEANQTVFVTSNWNKISVPYFKMSNLTIPEVRVIKERPQVVVLISDGCEKATWECVMYNEELGKYADKNIPFAGFLDPLIELLDNSGDKLLEDLQEIITDGTDVCVREQDDKTILIGKY